MAGPPSNPPDDLSWPYINANFPAIPPADPYVLPGSPFTTIIKKFGVRLGWGKSHICTCVGFATTMSPAGSPNQACITCQGRGIYWDRPLTEFIGLVTYGASVQAQNQPGALLDKQVGQIVQGEPRLTIPYGAGNGVIWDEASLSDIYVELDAITRFNATLAVGKNQVVPYQQSLGIAATGAVTTWDSATSGVVAVSGYSVSGVSVLLPASYPSGTPYVVEFSAAPTYVAYRLDGGLPHTRPFVQGEVAYPKRFHLAPLDLWLRSQSANDPL